MFVGQLVAIFTAEGSGAPMAAHEAIQAEAGIGLHGDRYAKQQGSFSATPGSGRQVTLVEREAVAAVNAEGTVTVTEAETRRNLVTEGVPLNHLVGQEFTIGEVVLRGTRLCEPCETLEGRTRPGVRRALMHRAGLRAEVVTGGTLHVGDRIAEVGI